MIIKAEIITQPYSGEFKEKIYDIPSSWNSQDWTWIKFTNDDLSEWCGNFRGFPREVAVSNKHSCVLVLSSDYLFKFDCASGKLTEYESQPQYRSLTISSLGDFIIADYHDIAIIIFILSVIYIFYNIITMILIKYILTNNNNKSY